MKGRLARWMEAGMPLGRIARLPLRLIPGEAVVPVLFGPGRGARWIVGSAPHSNWIGLNEPTKRRLFELALRPGGVVYDVGANAGCYTLLASARVGPLGRVVAFEPAPLNVAYLRRHLALNGRANVDVVEAAVVERTGRVRFDLNPDRVLGRVAEGGGVEVDAIALDDALAGGRPEPTCIKIDVEGAEGAVLRGARAILATARPVVFVATHGTEPHRECLEVLTEQGYRVLEMRGTPDELIGLPPRYDAPWTRDTALRPGPF